MKRTTFSTSRLDAWIVAVVKCFAERETFDGHRQERYADTIGRNLKNGGREDCEKD